jgi:hypothetical protein
MPQDTGSREEQRCTAKQLDLERREEQAQRKIHRMGVRNKYNEISHRLAWSQK